MSATKTKILRLWIVFSSLLAIAWTAKMLMIYGDLGTETPTFAIATWLVAGLTGIYLNYLFLRKILSAKTRKNHYLSRSLVYKIFVFLAFFIAVLGSFSALLYWYDVVESETSSRYYVETLTVWFCLSVVIPLLLVLLGRSLSWALKDDAITDEVGS